METWLVLNQPRDGHDKLVRLAQYSCKIIAGFQADPRTLQQLESSLAAARKIVRFGTCLDAFYNSVKSLSHPDPVMRFSTTMSRIALGMYLFCDHVLWLNSVHLLSVESKKWSSLANRCWLYSIILNLVKDVHELRTILSNYNQPAIGGFALTIQGVVDAYSPVAAFLCEHHRSLLLDFTKNSADICLPLSSLGWIPAGKMVGLCGVISSLLALAPLLEKRKRW